MSWGGILALSLSLAFTIMLAACGDGGSSISGSDGKLPHSTTPPPRIRPKVVAVQVRDHAIKIPGTLTPGPTLFQITNSGKLTHFLEIQRIGTLTRFGLNLLPGDTGELKIDLKPGRYQVWCPFSQTDGAQMSLEIQVPASGSIAGNR